MNELELIKRKDLREELIDRIEVLDKVKSLLLLPDIMMATRQQVADFYEVDESAIRKIEVRHRDEIDLDGFKVWRIGDFKERTECPSVKSNRGYFEVHYSNNTIGKYQHNGVALYTRRAILRIGMLLRDSEIAKEIRTQLLNIEEKTTQEQKISSITEEQQLMLDVMCAVSEGERLLAFSKFNDYKNRYINILEDKIDILVNGILTWNPREGCNRMVRQIAGKVFDSKFGKAWSKVYAEMLYKHNIGIARRIKESRVKDATIFDVLDDGEMTLLVKSCISLCEMYNINIDDLFIDLKE